MNEPKKNKYLSVKNHLIALFSFQAITFILSSSTAVSVWVPKHEEGILVGMFYAVFLFMSSIGAWWISGFWFRTYIFAKCPKCNGKAQCKGRKPIKYVCSECGNIHYTPIKGL